MYVISVGKCRLKIIFVSILGINTKALELQRDRHTSESSGYASEVEELVVNVSPETINAIKYENRVEIGSYFVI